MNRKAYIQTLISVVLVFFLFTPTFVKAFSSSVDQIQKRVGVTNSAGTNSKIDSQWLFEEKETEEKNSESVEEQALVLIYEIISYQYDFAPVYFSIYLNLCELKYGRVPLFLFKRSILI